jgi:hypothetical protein
MATFEVNGRYSLVLHLFKQAMNEYYCHIAINEEDTCTIIWHMACLRWSKPEEQPQSIRIRLGLILVKHLLLPALPEHLSLGDEFLCSRLPSAVVTMYGPVGRGGGGGVGPRGGDGTRF